MHEPRYVRSSIIERRTSGKREARTIDLAKKASRK